MKKYIFPFMMSVFHAFTPANAAVTANNFITPQTPTRGIVQFNQGTDPAGVYKTLYTAGTNGSRCFGGYSTNSDPSATHLITIQVFNGSAAYGGTSVISTLLAGYGSTLSQPFMTSGVWPGLPVDQYGNPYIQLMSGDTLKVAYSTSLTSSKFLNVVIFCEDF